MTHNPFKIVRDFEEAIAEYCGSPYAVSCDSCTNAIFLCLEYIKKTSIEVANMHRIPIVFNDIIIPSMTYLSVAMSIIRAGFQLQFSRGMNDWSGEYKLYPCSIWDSARRLRKGMYRPGQFQCLSFHIRKHLPIGKGGMILTDNLEAVEWLRRARYEGRGEMPYKEDDITMIGFNHYMTPEQAARGLALLQQLPDWNEDLPEPGGYRDLSTFTIFKDIKVIE